MEEWGFETSECSIKHSWPSKLGDFGTHQIASSQKLWKRSIIGGGGGGNFLEVKLGVRPSFAWRSILSSCELLKEGLIWRIGNGDKVCIWQDKWIPRSSTVLMQPQQPYWDPNARVSSLIDHETNWWKSDVLGDLFDE
jgi:hypothetical protein